MSVNMDTALSKAVQVRVNGHPVLQVSFNALPLDCPKTDTRQPMGYSYLSADATLTYGSVLVTKTREIPSLTWAQRR